LAELSHQTTMISQHSMIENSVTSTPHKPGTNSQVDSFFKHTRSPEVKTRMIKTTKSTSVMIKETNLNPSTTQDYNTLSSKQPESIENEDQKYFRSHKAAIESVNRAAKDAFDTVSKTPLYIKETPIPLENSNIRISTTPMNTATSPAIATLNSRHDETASSESTTSPTAILSTEFETRTSSKNMRPSNTTLKLSEKGSLNDDKPRQNDITAYNSPLADNETEEVSVITSEMEDLAIWSDWTACSLCNHTSTRQRLNPQIASVEEIVQKSCQLEQPTMVGLFLSDCGKFNTHHKYRDHLLWPPTCWMDLPAFSETPGCSSMVAAASETELYACGNHGTNCKKLSIGNSNWELIPDLIHPRVNYTLTAVGNKLVAIGGIDSHRSVVVLEEGTWERKSWFLMKRHSHCAVSLEEDRVIIIGGHNTDYGTLDLVQELNIITGEVYLLSHLARGRFAHGCATHIVNGEAKVIVAGGTDGQHALDSVEIYSICVDRWESGPPLKTLRFKAPLAVIEGIPTVFGTHSVEQLRNGSWVERRMLPQSSFSMSALVSVPCLTEYNVNLQIGK